MCQEFAENYTDAIGRCGGPYTDVYDLMSLICNNSFMIVDIDSFRKDCIAWPKSAECYEFDTSLSVSGRFGECAKRIAFLSYEYKNVNQKECAERLYGHPYDYCTNGEYYPVCSLYIDASVECGTDMDLDFCLTLFGGSGPGFCIAVYCSLTQGGGLSCGG